MPNLDRDAGSVEEKKGLVGDDDEGEEEESVFYIGVSVPRARCPPM